MDARNHDIDIARADFYLCVAQAMMAPMDGSHADAILGGDLVGDLFDLDREIGYGLAREIEALQASLEAVRNREELLILYSQLFLAPPRKVQLNAATYLDGSFNGGTVMELEQCYAEHGVARAESFHDLADHVSVQLEFIGHLFRRRAEAADHGDPMTPGRFIARYPLRWISPLVEDVRRVTVEMELTNNPYLPLLTILEAAFDNDAEQREGALSPTERREKALDIARMRQAERAVSAEEMKVIRQRLEAHGLSADHLDPDRKDDPFAGWEAMVPPSPKR